MKDIDIRELLLQIEGDDEVLPVDEDLQDEILQYIDAKKSRSQVNESERAKNIALIKMLREQKRREDYSGFERFFTTEGPYSYKNYRRHYRFFAAGRTYRERAFRAGNRTGKTVAGCYEVALHATGKYKDWWPGRRFDHPVDIWVAGDTNQTTRDILQRELMGPPGKFGTGLIPKEDIVSWKSKPSVPNAIEYVEVRHVNGDTSVIGFKSYDQGRESFQGTAKHFILLDEEPPNDVYNECLIRTMVTKDDPIGGMMAVTFTPLKGFTEFIDSFEKECDQPEYGPNADLNVTRGDSPNSRFMVQAGVDHVPHLDEQTIKDILSKYGPAEQKSRRDGIPRMGAGAVYPIPQEEYIIDPISRPAYWKKAYGMDVGWEKTAIVWGAYDPDEDVVYIYGEHYRGNAEPEIHASAVKYRGAWMNGVIDPAARGRSQIDGKRLLNIYRKLGLKVIPADNAVEAGIYEVWSRLSTGRLKISSTCVNLLHEMKLYRRDDNGKIHKRNDHLCDALRYLIMTGLKVAKANPVKKEMHGSGARDYGV